MKILKACHIDPTSGHMGVKKILNRIKERFLWDCKRCEQNGS